MNKKELESKKKKIGGGALFRKLANDDAFKKYRRIVKAIKENYDLEAIMEEAHTLHSGRSSRNLKGTNPGGQKIADAALLDGSYRSRMSQLLVKLFRQRDLLEISIQAAKAHIVKDYGDSMPTYRTKAERSNALDIYVASGVTMLSNIESVIRCLELLIKDIDQMSFTLRLSYQCVEIVADKRREL
jgi:hypothetical protein